MLRALMLRKKISDAQKELEDLRAKSADFETRAAELEKREAEIATSIEEASTDEEKAAVEEAATSYEADKAAFDSECEENAKKIEDLEGEVSEMEQELEDLENQQRTVNKPQEQASSAPKTITSEERKINKMFKTRSLNAMSFEARAALVEREDVKATLASVRSLIKEKRTVTGAEVFIGTTVFDLVKENILEYSKLYQRVKAQFTNSNGRVPFEGTIPEAIWVECCDSIPELAISFGSIDLLCNKVAGFFAVCNSRVEDADIDLIDALTDALSAALGKAVDKAIIYGTGVKMPTGVVTAINADDNLKTTNLVTIASGTTGKDLFKELIKASGKADGKYSTGSKLWICSDKTRVNLVAEAIEFNAAGSLVSGVEQKMPVDGGDIVTLDFMADDNVVVGYFDLYALLVKRGFTLAVSTEVRFIEDQTVIKGTARMDGKPVVKGAFVAIGIGSAPATSATFPAVPTTAVTGEG